MEQQNQDTPKWLKEIQNNSWNPELLISGLSIVFIFSISDMINDLIIKLIIEYNTNLTIAFLGGLYINFALFSLKIAFSLHLALRGVWVGFVGLSYAFPQGVNEEKLSKTVKIDFIRKSIKQPQQIVLLLERICSSIFSLAFTMVGLSVFITLSLALFLLLQLIGVPVLYSSLVFLAILLSQSLVSFLYPHLQKWLGKDDLPALRVYIQAFQKLSFAFFFRESILIFSTNLNRFVVLGTLFIYSMAMGLTGSMSSERVILFIKSLQPSYELIEYIRKNKPKDDRVRPDVLMPHQYADQLTPGHLVQKAMLLSMKTSSGFLELYVVDYASDREVYEQVNQDTLQYFTIAPLVQVTINEQPLAVPEWLQTTIPETGQNAWLAMLDIQDLKRGKHVLRIDKSMITIDTEELIDYEGWTTIPFWVE